MDVQLSSEKKGRGIFSHAEPHIHASAFDSVADLAMDVQLSSVACQCAALRSLRFLQIRVER